MGNYPLSIRIASFVNDVFVAYSQVGYSLLVLVIAGAES